MTGRVQAGTTRPGDLTASRRRLSPRWRDLLLMLHVTVSVGAFGTDVVLLVLGVTGLISDDPDVIRAGYIVMGLLADRVLVPLALAALLTGVLLGLGTRWGLARHLWVLAKLVLTLGAATAAVILLRPALNAAAAQALVLPLAELSTTGIGSLGVVVTAASAGAALVLLTTVALAVYKPWGRTRFGRR